MKGGTRLHRSHSYVAPGPYASRVTKSSALDPRVSLATSLHAQPGMYSLLLGSGTSTGAGIPTGWGVVQELTRRAAAASGDAPDEAFDADTWWATNGDGKPLGYSGLLDALTATPSERRALLASFFEPDDEDRKEGRKVPGAAHKAVAELVRRGYVRVIITTNFDRLIEQALEAVGVFPQVITGPQAVAGMEPLTHAKCTVIKLHGDYASAHQLNTLEELSAYSDEMNALLRRVLDEYGLIVNGWSAEWDHALVAAIESTAARRYPLYWSSFSGLTPPARRLVAQHRASLIDAVTADAFFSDLTGRLDALETLSVAPLSLEMTVARVKRCLPDPVRHIELRDIFDLELERVRDFMRDRPFSAAGFDISAVDEGHAELEELVRPLLRIFSLGVLLDRDRQHTDLWVWVIQQLLNARRTPTGTSNDFWVALQHYPALLTLRVGVAAAVETGHEDVAVRLLREPTWRNPFGSNDRVPAMHVLHDYALLTADFINKFPRWNSSNGWLYPQSHLVRAVTAPTLSASLGDNDEGITLAAGRAEFRIALAQHLWRSSTHYRPAPGEYLLERHWDHTDSLIWVQDFLDHGDPEAWGLQLTVDGPSTESTASLTALVEGLKQSRRWG